MQSPQNLVQVGSHLSLGQRYPHTFQLQSSSYGHGSILEDMEVDIVGEARNPLVDLPVRSDERSQMTTKLLGEILNQEDESESAFESLGSFQQQQPFSIAQIDNEISAFLKQEKPESTEDSSTQNQNNKPKNNEKSSFTEKLRSSDYLVTLCISLGILFLIFIFKLFTSSCPCFNFTSDPTMKEATYTMFRETVYVLICILVLLQLYNYEVLEFAKEPVMKICIIALFSILVWACMGIVLIIAAQKEYSVWKALEANSNNYEHLARLRHEYERFYYDRLRKRQYQDLDPIRLEQITYTVMRLEFINPVYLPPLKETFLRKDFNFAKYLAYSYGKTLTQFFNTKWVTVLLLVVFVNGICLLELNENNWTNTIVNFVLPIFFLIVFFVTYYVISSIESKLYPQIKYISEENGYIEYIIPEELNFHHQYDGIDPFAFYDNFPQPKYLEIDNGDLQRETFERQSMDQDDDQDQLLRRSDVAFNAHYQQNNHIFGQPNRHEALFIGGRNGKGILLVTIQLFYLLSILYFSTYVSFSALEAFNLYQSHENTGVFVSMLAVTILCPLILIVEWIVLFPLILRSLAISTNVTLFTYLLQIEMMKDQKIMEKVIGEQKMERAKVSYRIFQVFKLIRRELIAEMRKQQEDFKLRNITSNQIIEAFNQCGGRIQKFIGCEKFQLMVKFCGNNLTSQESFIFLKKSNSQGDQIHYNDFSKAVEMNLNDAKIDPYYLVLFLLTMFFNDRKKVTFEEFKQFFGEFETYFQEEDWKFFLEEVKYIKRERELIDFRELASLIRDDIESFPK